MDALRIHGGATLRGEINVSGSKNAALPILVGGLLAPGKSVISRVPDLADIRTLTKLLSHLGAHCTVQEDTVSIDSSHLDAPFAPYDLVRTMRASILVLGPLLARGGTAKVSLPGGCAIGARPIDQHLKGFEKMGATISIEHGYVIAKAPLVTSKGVTSEGRETKGSQRKLHGAEIIFDMPTVGGTENLLMAATLAEGQTVLKNVAKEPEIIDLANFLISMGADITGAGSEEIIINGVTELRPAHYEVMADRIEFGTFVIAGAMAGDPLTVVGGNPSDQSALLAKLRESGANIEIEDDKVIISKGKRPTPLSIDTAPYPGFPTDMQAQLMAYLATGTGSSVVSEQIFENRFMHVPELNRLGAHIDVTGGKAVVHGVDKLSGTTVMATDLRASASLVLAGLVADGVTTVRRIYHLDRGYEKIGAKLGAVGAKIERFTEGDE